MDDEADGADELARQSEVPVSEPEVKSGVVPRKSRPLPGETCPASGVARERGADTIRGNTVGERTGVSRGRRSARRYEPGVGYYLPQGEPKAPEGLTPARRTEPSGTAETAATCQLELALAAVPGARSLAAETDCGQSESGLWGAGHAGALGRLSLPAAAEGGAGSSGDGREGVITTEPPGTDPYAGWCGGRWLITTGYPIGRLGLHG
jgi:hypothetical protein